METLRCVGPRWARHGDTTATALCSGPTMQPPCARHRSTIETPWARHGHTMAHWTHHGGTVGSHRETMWGAWSHHGAYTSVPLVASATTTRSDTFVLLRVAARLTHGSRVGSHVECHSHLRFARWFRQQRRGSNPRLEYPCSEAGAIIG